MVGGGCLTPSPLGARQQRTEFAGPRRTDRPNRKAAEKLSDTGMCRAGVVIRGPFLADRSVGPDITGDFDLAKERERRTAAGQPERFSEEDRLWLGRRRW
jgi:hypothetical protein